MIETKAMIEGHNSLNAKFQSLVEIDEKNLVFTIKRTSKI